MLTSALIDRILATIPTRVIGVLGDLFLDRYLDLDAALTEPSIETGLDAYQVVRVRSCPGAAGTVLNNLAALGVGRIIPISVIGDDGEGYELRQALRQLPGVELDHILTCTDRRTPTYTKPMIQEHGQEPRELNRLDVKNRSPASAELEGNVLQHLASVWPALDALLVLDQVSEPECGVATTRVRASITALAEKMPERIIVVDSRQRIGLFRGGILKPNERECERAAPGSKNLCDCVRQLAALTNAQVICTRGEMGTLVMASARSDPVAIPAYPVSGPIDPVGAGDSSSAALACALVSGANLLEAAAFGNLVASITIQQIGCTGTATPHQVRARWRNFSSN